MDTDIPCPRPISNGMKIALIISSLILAAFAERLLGPLLAPYFLPPFFALTVLFWFLYLPLASRLGLGGLAGWAMDSISLLPLGAYVASFFFAAVLIEVLGVFILQSESALIRLVTLGALIIVFLIISPGIGFLIQAI